MNQNRKIIYAGELMDAIRDDMTIRGAAYAAVVKHINDAPAADAAPVVHGRWIETTSTDKEFGVSTTKYECSECSCLAEHKSDYCSHCGAKMDLPCITDAAAAALEKMGANVHGGDAGG